MTVTVPNTDRTGAAVKQAAIAVHAARADSFSQQLTNQEQIELVNSLLDQQKLVASTILSTVTINNKTHPLFGQRSTLQGLANTTTAAGLAAGVTLEQVERAIVGELMISGQVSAATILAHPSLSYIGGAHN